MMKTKLWHKKFTWDGHSFTTDQDIIDFVADHYPELTMFINEWFGDSGQIHMKTSGSTGKPKTIVLSREHMINSARATAAYFDLKEGSRALLCLPLGFIAGRMMLVRSMVMGWYLDIIESTSKPIIPKQIQYDFSAMVPLQLYNSCDQLENIKSLIVGGGEVSETILNKISSLGTKIYATYGMTETITHIALSPLNKSAGKRGSEIIFTALPKVQLSTDDRQCLRINAPHIGAEELVTNDIVELIADDSFKWLARYDHVINSGGIKLIPELIEKKLQGLIEPSFFISALDDEVLGKRMIMIVEQEEITDLLTMLRKFQENNTAVLSRIEIPKEVYFLKSFLYTDTGKIQRELTKNLVLKNS